uniref:Uncharacterized protein n=1 Tax=Romanomermis culicivorax TaxID=13658 RepID=A0A915HH62_ROMCU
MTEILTYEVFVWKKTMTKKDGPREKQSSKENSQSFALRSKVYFSKNYVTTIQPCGLDSGDEELATVGVRP